MGENTCERDFVSAGHLVTVKKMSKMPVLNSVPVQTFQVKNTGKSRKLNSVSGIVASNTSGKGMRVLQSPLNWLHSDKIPILDPTKLCYLHFTLHERQTCCQQDINPVHLLSTE